MVEEALQKSCFVMDVSLRVSLNLAVSTIRMHGALYYLHDIFQDFHAKIYFALKKYMEVYNFFNQPVESMCLVFRNDIQIIPLNENFRKCLCMP